MSNRQPASITDPMLPSSWSRPGQAARPQAPAALPADRSRAGSQPTAEGSANQTREPSADDMPAGRRPFPAGLALIASVQFLITGLIVVMAVLLPMGRGGANGRVLHQIAAGWPALLLLASGTGLVLRKGWGWRLSASLFWFLTGNPVFDLVVSLVEHRPFSLLVNAVVLVVAAGSLVYLNGAARMAVFGFSEPGSIARARPLPMVAGVAAAAVRCLATVLA